ncbi:DUF882 domain-containing protein [Jiella mangrovi]|uniref:Murein endopeptidase K n=1 Tax=Jiella mangrovi TaxID=2821407 RepID=A0ABS4BL64_9HYPH|nr:DUF882 domain-containing protein [Jiella mangrovi]MBP0617468.1 DUF882 domain-containing protein [Jiella mangrovi]
MFGRTDGARRLAVRLAAMAVAAVLSGAFASAASAETRTLKFYNLHTKEKGAFAYKVNGRYNQSQLKKINWFLRDWRKAKATTMDPRLLDLIWEAYRQSGSNGYINVICGYRSPATNAMLRSRSSGVAKQSQHTLGRALDFYIPDVPLKKMREIGLKMQVGGVGYYPRSGSPFVHFDIGNARHWPRMNRRELLAVFPNGGTVHVPSDGKPLPGYNQALASYKSRRSQSEIQVANASSSSSSGGGKSLIAMLFGSGDTSDESEDEADVATPAVAPARAAPARDPVQVAAVIPQRRPSRDLPSGVSVQVADTFDTGTPSASAAPAAPAAAEVAALDMARVPLPTFAARVAPTPAAEPATSEVGALVAALETEKPEESLASGQLAYAVPTPTDRPNFDVLLNGGVKVEKRDEAAAAINALASRDKNEVAAVVPKNRPAAPRVAARDVPKPGLVAASYRETPAPRRTAAKLIEVEPRKSTIEAEVIAGKGGRVVAVSRKAAAGTKAAAGDQETITSRIALASVVSAPRRSADKAGQHPSGDLGRALRAKGFTLTEVRFVD